MKIALLAPFEEPVPPEKYGGTELVVSNLAETLVTHGHEVYLLATGDSKTTAKLVPIFPEAIRKNPQAMDQKVRDALKFVGMGKVLTELQKLDVDVIHNHIGWRFLSFAPLFKAPTVTTLHSPLDIPYQRVVFELNKNTPFVSISNAQRAPHPELNYAATVYNGIAVDRFDFNEKPEGYLAFLGRMSPQKGPLDAIEIAKATGKNLIMAAKVDSVDMPYFEEKVKPLIDGKQIRFIGEVDHAGKNELLKNADALLAPINWREPFGLFIVEALACGTPVIARNMGAVPELMQSAKHGFICETNQEMITAVSRINTIDRKTCRQWAEATFSSEHMTKGYEAVYQKLLSS